jgi:hypothetical protein
VKALAVPALSHRVITRGGAGAPGGGIDPEAVIRTLVQDVPVPR